ncbi:MAG: hypothetical protein ACWGON_03040 [Gemmatimonadota bacterium]
MNTEDVHIDGALLTLVKKYSNATDDDIESAFESSRSFRSLCFDLRACSRALARWQRSDSEEAWCRVDEYSGLLTGLTAEIHLMLAERDCARPGHED